MSATGIEYQSFTAFHNAVRANVAPEGLAEGLIPVFRSWVGYALSHIQQIVPWYRDYNVQFYNKDQVEEFCNTSSFQGPQGKISQIFAFKPYEDCKRFYYQKRSPAALDCWMDRQRCLCPASEPPSSAIYVSPNCNYVVNGEAACAAPYLTEEEDDCKFKSLAATDRMFAVSPNYKVHAAPRFPCGYILCVQWQGIKKQWRETDLVPIDNQLQETVEHFVDHKLFMKEHQGAVSEYWNAYTLSLRLLNHRYRDEQEEEAQRDCSTAIERQLTTFLVAYPGTPYAGIVEPEVELMQVFIDRPPNPPDNPLLPALSYPSGGGPILQWLPDTQEWV